MSSAVWMRLRKTSPTCAPFSVLKKRAFFRCRIAFFQTLSPEGLPHSPTWTLGADCGAFGWSVAGVGDTGADGYDDLVVGAPEIDSAFLFFGSRNGPFLAWAFRGLERDRTGESVSAAGDVNGDGFNDVLAGRAIYRGGEEPAWEIADEPECAGAGDIDGDGVTDLVAGRDGAVSMWRGLRGAPDPGRISDGTPEPADRSPICGGAVAGSKSLGPLVLLLLLTAGAVVRRR